MGLLKTVVGVGVKALDDRGNEVAAVDPHEILAGVGKPGYPPKHMATRLKLALSRQSGRINLVNIGIIVGGIVILSFMLGGLWRLFPAAGFGVRMAVFVAGLAGIGFVLKLVARGVVAPNIAATAVAEGLCGSCGYRLNALATAEDGCVMCPECGSAWFACRITRPCSAETPRADPLSFATATLRVSRYTASIGADDRGCITLLLNGALQPLSRERRKAIERNSLAAIKKSLRPVGRFWRILWTTIAMFCFLFLWVIGMGGAISNHDREGTIGFAIVGGIFGVVAGVAWKWGAFGRLSAVKKVLLEQRRCPTCLEDLSFQAPDADGYSTCPVCGSGWRLPLQAVP
jgi:hypothetical protein